jgi:hypothetical protein
MAFLSKKVSKIFPSSKGGNCQDDPSPVSRPSQHHKGNGRVIAIFRKLSPEASKPKTSDVASTKGGSRSGIFSVTRKQSMANCQQQQPQESPSTTQKKHGTQLITKGDTFDRSEYYDYENNSDAATLESSPTTPRPRDDTVDPRLMSLPDLPELAFPSNQQDSMYTPSIPMMMNHHNTNQSGGSSGTTRSNPSSLRLLPRPLPPVPIEKENDKVDNNNNVLRNSCCDNSRTKHDHDLPPPVVSVSIPVGMGPFVLPPTTNANKTRACLSGPPPRAGEWDDATLESHPPEKDEQEDDDDYGFDYDTTYETRIANHRRNSSTCSNSTQAATTPTKSPSYLESSPSWDRLSLSEQQHQQQQQEKRDKATAQAMATMKPWIERAALLALLQTRASSHSERERDPSRRNHRNSGIVGQRNNIRRNQAAFEDAAPSPRFRQREIGRNRALLASLEPLERQQGQDYSEEATAKVSSGTNERQQLQQQHPRPPRIVKWYIVGH